MSSTTDLSSDSFFSSILKPGSSLHPTFLLILDGAFTSLLVILVTLLYLLSGSIHIVFLITIELALWASVKWFVNELKLERARMEQRQQNEPKSSEETRKTQ